MILRKNILPRSIGDACVTTFVFIIVPIIYYFELFVVLPNFFAQWSPWYTFNFVLGTFILFNICSNLVAIMMCDTSIKGRLMPSNLRPNWKFCLVCESVTPPRSWHCNVCNVCILKRDHHCMFTSCCIGHENHRYFLMLVLYIFIATTYASCYNVFFIIEHISFTSWISIVKVVFPLATLFLKWSASQVYIFLVLIVLLGCGFTGFLLCFHLNLILSGAVTHERNNKINEYDKGKWLNLVESLGENWTWIWLSPFIESKLPHEGIYWEKKQSTKVK